VADALLALERGEVDAASVAPAPKN
jgi:hypothetical protein